MGVVMLGPLIIRYGTGVQRRDILPRILSGEVLWCQGYSEPSAGSDLASLRTSAVADGDDFIVNGQKIWTSFAHEADMIFLLVRTDPRARKQEGISFLLADMRSPGITVKRIRNLGGGAEFCEVFLDNVRVPRSNLVGGLNEGWTMAKSLLGSERIMIGNPRGARAPLLRLRELARATGLEEDPAWRARHDELRLDVDDLDALFVRCADVLRRGLELGPEVSMLKIWVTEAQQRVADLMLETAGESGVTDGSLALPGGALHPANAFFSARPASIYGGSNEIQRNILAKGVLELPG
jgi:alkylation response protein AidB-like acyl-CoA dehydrogenase